MARAKRHYISGKIWHITHRCHKKEFLLKFGRDRSSWLQWLLQAKKRYKLVILNYTVTSNHIHLIVADDSGRDVIPQSIKLVAGRTGQEYNVRKNRSGAYWEDRYHATAIESGEHLLRCIVYIDLNMPRTGKVCHPSEWAYGGYREIQNPRRKNILISYDRLCALAGFGSYDEFRENHRDWVENALSIGNNIRDSKWTQSIAVGSEGFIENMKADLGVSAKGRKVVRAEDGFQLRETLEPYNAGFEVKNNDIGSENSYLWDE
jgi:putative transposase